MSPFAFADSERFAYDIRNYLPNINEQREMFHQLGFGLQERVEILHRKEGEPLYRYALCQYRIEDRQVVLPDFSHLSDSRVRYDQITADDRQACPHDGNCPHLELVDYLEAHPPAGERTWFHKGTVIQTDSKNRLSCVYYMNGSANHHADLFFELHPSMDRLLQCPQRDYWLAWSPPIAAAVVLAIRFPALGTRLVRAVPLATRAMASGAGLMERVGSLGRYLHVFELLAARGLLKLEHAQRLDGVLKFLLSTATLTLGADYVHRKMVEQWPWYAQWHDSVVTAVSSNFSKGADFYEDHVIGDARHLLGQDYGAYFNAQDSSGYPEVMPFARLFDMKMLEYLNFKRNLMHGVCMSEYTGLGNPNLVFKIQRHDDDFQRDYLQLYFGQRVGAVAMVDPNVTFWDSLRAYWSYDTYIDAR